MKSILIAALLGSTLTACKQHQSPPASSGVWHASGTLDDVAITRDTSVAHDGRTSVRFVAEEPPRNYGGIFTTFPAAPYEERRLRVSAYLRAAQLIGRGGVVWARADGGSFAFSTSQATPLLGSTGWTRVDVALDVPRGAKDIVVGVYSNGQGTLWVDDVRVQSDSVSALHFGFEALADFQQPPHRVIARSPREAPSALSPNGRENLIAFTHLLGYVRFFHPAPEVVRVNWDEFAVRGMRVVEGAPNADSLAGVLRALFAPIAPSVVIYRTGEAAPLTAGRDEALERAVQLVSPQRDLRH